MSTSRPRRPLNLLFIWSDQQRPDTIGAYRRAGGHGSPLNAGEAARTPHLDQLAATGTLFQQAYCTQPVCTPARASVLTGTYPHTHGCYQNSIQLSPHLPTLAELLRPAGYACGYVGKWHLGNELGRVPPGRRGFDECWVSTEDGYVRSHAAEGYSDYHQFLLDQGYVPGDGHRDGVIFNRATAARMPEAHGKPAFQAAACTRFLDEHQTHPFLLMVNFLEPHAPTFGPFDAMYSPDDVTLPASWYRDFEPTVPLRYRVRQEALRQHLHLGEYDRLTSNDERGWRELIARYWGLVSLVDKYVGQILAHLDALGLAENTIVVYTCDHGDMMGEHHLVTKSVHFEGATRVPLIIRVPGQPARRIDYPVSQVALLPALLELLGQDVPEHMPARSLTGPLRGDPTSEPEDVFIEWNGVSGFAHSPFDLVPDHLGEADLQRLHTLEARTIRRGRWKLNVNRSGEPELYDLDNDPGETHNARFDAGSERVTALLFDRLLRWQRETGDTLSLPNPLGR